MIPYIAGFLCSILLFYYADYNNFQGKGINACVIIGLAIPCVIAGLRAPTIGTDVLVYAEPLLLCAKSANGFFEFIQSSVYSILSYSYKPIIEYEIGYLFVTYVVAKLFNSLPAFLFITQALTVVPIYKGLRAFSDDQPVWLGMTVYYLMFFNQSLNMMRQWIAMAMLFQAFQYIIKKQYWRYWRLVVVASLFHYTAVVGIVVLIAYRFLTTGSLKLREQKVWITIFGGIFLLLSLNWLANLLLPFGIRYVGYMAGKLRFMPNQLLYRLPILLLFAWRWRYIRNKNQHAELMFIFVVMDVLMSQLTSVYENSGRIAVYFSEYYMLSYPMLCKSSVYKGNRRVMQYLVIAYLCVYWWYTYVYVGSSETVPYISIFG